MPPRIGQHYEEEFNFRSPAVLADGSVKSDFMLSEHIQGKYAVLFFYTLDFSYVCPTELISIKNRIEQFKQLGTEVVAISGDSHLSHTEWRSQSVEQGGVGALPFAMVSDISRNIAKEYGILVNDSMPLRGVYIIDNEGYFRYQVIHDLPIGRNIDEILRVLCGLQAHQSTGDLLPAGWMPGESLLNPEKPSLKAYLKENAETL